MIKVGSFKPNALGLYDMHGNVWEWVADCWNKTYEGAPKEGLPWTTGDCRYRVLRGGSSYRDARNQRSAIRDRNWPDIWLSYDGFRISRTLTL